MDVPKFKDIVQKLSVFKSYSSLVWPIVIALAAILLFVPIQLFSGKLKGRITTESISLGRRVSSLKANAVAGDQWQIEREYQQAYEKDANQIALLARQTAERELLNYKIFPEPKDVSAFIFAEFGRQYRRKIDELITSVNGRDCPSGAELQKSVQSSLVSRTVPDRGMGASSQKSADVDEAIKEALCRAKAESASVYVNPYNLSGYQFWENFEYVGMSDAVDSCWYYQLAYWVIEDVFDTIRVMNSGSSSVFTSPVKRLMNVSFTQTSAKSTKGKADNRPSYVLNVYGGLVEPWTARVCKDDIDVVHFDVTVVVSAKSVFQFMKQLCSAKQHKFKGWTDNDPEQTFRHNQITVLESDVSPVDLNAKAHNLYRYGDDTVVELDLVCEYIFNKKGYDVMKPKSVKEVFMQPAK